MRLYKMELYKLCHKKIFLIGLAAIAALMFLFFWFVEVGDELAVVDGKTYSGYEAVQMNRKITKEFAGTITDEKIDQIVGKYGISSKLIENMPGWRDGNYLSDFITRYFTDGSMEQGVLPTERYSLEESELGDVCERLQVTPALEYTKGWKIFIEMLGLGFMMGSVLVICSVSRVFAGEETTKMLPLIFTTEEGRRKDIAAKIAASITLTIIIFAAILLFNTLLCGVVFGFDGFDNLSGIVLLSYFSMVNQQPFLNYVTMVILFGMQGLLSLCAVTLCISAQCKSSFSAVIAAAICWCVPLLVRMIFRGLLSIVILATPIFLTMNGMIEDIYPFWRIAAVISMFIGVGCMVGGYKKYQTKNA
ncbi:MAG: ABC transporter permease subunit [Hespellia sp.]|nr:ABC transporter permease subunit [Hespellia sp.]